MRPADLNARLRARFAGALLPLLVLCACGSGSEGGAGGVSEGEARAVDEAAEMLDRQKIPDGAVPPVETPADQTESGPQRANAPVDAGEDADQNAE